MKMNISLMKLTIRLLVLMIFCVILFLILAVLYSSRYWPDVYNYINANITIKRIPTLSELNLTVFEVDVTTEFYTTEDYAEASTVEGLDIDIDNFTNALDDMNVSNRITRDIPIEDFYDNNRIEYPQRQKRNIKDLEIDSILQRNYRNAARQDFREDNNANQRKDFNNLHQRSKRNTDTENLRKENGQPRKMAMEDLERDYSEVPTSKVLVDYLFLEDTTFHEGVIVTRIVKDLIHDSKLVPKNYQDVEIMDTLNEVDSQKLSDADNKTDSISDIFPWISTIFLKNDSKSNQYEYFCDGALLNDKLLITAARCVNLGNTTVDADSLLVILGKRSLLSVADMEKTVKIKQIITHENFTNENGKVENDLALLTLENPITFNEIIQPASIGNDTQDVEKLATTAWNLQGDIIPVYLDDKENQVCNSRDAGKHMFCATYGQDVALCPSYGGVFAARQEDSWFLYGIRSGDTTDRGLCFDKHVWFTDLRNYEDWIMENFE